ncbi:bifunctional riboflavin kinase/FAD synthetase [Domibacillus sp. DTU_2020_1001157_1_SI_ALB_TIR_016]|uniref:bifunctional riboflavin kinase/FAD synthetase n=1 Tax=Domibacillus sp. DTU_2020_1001157_1_SI_ALB_TIR_016 TaxID=3077789 RepID=UPI0028E90B5C|nr:bifunctional riboflavin kinase/FAD synthetase [Domibacillus sp. DTU_2020_1001157_1_SI_ALB_TIR_016]WNS79685.1 bifunctional riboflavin kinase/FAD synthetase [Domibacillus sp. DTU_2020_1001157_1_SI_ALB_TIR_016]
MDVIMLRHPHSHKKEEFEPMALALGFFDGVHKGHQQVISAAKKTADKHGWKSAVMTFDPHPSVVLGRKHQHIRYITPLEEKKRLIADLGIDYLFVVRFTSDFAALEPQQFVDQYIIGLNVQHVTAGFDYTYGRLGKGTMETLLFHSRGAFAFTSVDKLEFGEEKVSSTKIRELLSEGLVRDASDLLGRPYRMHGTVIHGDKRGRKMGFPTANIEPDDDYFLPRTGVYAVKIRVKNEWHEGVCNVGFRPTFKSPDKPVLSIEVHIFQYTGDIYGEEVEVDWFIRLRGEQKFSGIEELAAQIERDKKAAVHFFDSKRLDEEA